MRFHARITDRNIIHTRISLFANGALAGQLYLRNDEADEFLDIMVSGAGANQHDFRVIDESKPNEVALCR